MALVIEDGTGVAGAESYATAAELTTYATDRGITLTGDAEELLLRANDYLETLQFIGYKLTKDQSLQWPRADVTIDGFGYQSDELPSELKVAQMEVAIAADQEAGPFAVISRETKREKFDVFETEYADSAASRPIAPALARSLRKLVAGGATGGTAFRVVRV